MKIDDLLLAEPRLEAINDATTNLHDIEFTGLCRLGDGDVAGWLVLVDGTELTTELVHRCQQAAGIILYGKIPPGLLLSVAVTAAERAGLAVIRAPKELSARELIQLVQTVASSKPDTAVWHRLTALSTMSAELASNAPEQALLAKYNALTRNLGLVLDPDAKILASVGELPVRTIVRSIRGVEPVTHYFHVGRWLLTAVPLTPPEPGARFNPAGVYWLVVAKREDEASHHVKDTAPILNALIHLLKVAIEAKMKLTRAEQFRDSRVVSELVFGSSDYEKLQLQLMARGFGTDLHYRIVVAGHKSAATEPGVAVAAVAKANAARVPMVITALDRRIVIVVGGPAPGTENLSGDIRALVETLPKPVGISAPSDNLMDGPQLYWQAQVARLSSTAEPSGAYTDFRHARPLVRAAGQVGEETLRAVVAPLAQRMQEIPGGTEFFLAAVEEDFDVRAVARRLSVHPNTARNRISALFGDGEMTKSDVELWYYSLAGRS